MKTAVLTGIAATLTTVALSRPASRLSILGMTEIAARETAVRVRSALIETGVIAGAGDAQAHVQIDPPAAHSTASLDLPIALMLLGRESDERWAFGELSLTGGVRPVRGIVSLVEAARDNGATSVFVPWDNAEEAAVVSGITILPVRCLLDVLEGNFEHFTAPPILPTEVPSWDEVKQTNDVKNAAIRAATAGQNILLVGPPGSGKTMLARRLVSCLPTLRGETALEVLRIYSAAGLVGPTLRLGVPFRAPHHTISDVGLIGGGAPYARPGEATLAHNGVLFLDELPEFRRNVLDALCPLVFDHEVRLHNYKTKAVTTFPANFLLVAAMNPCPCGWAGHPKRKCSCTSEQVKRYLSRMDPYRFLFKTTIEVPAIDYSAK